MTRVSATLCFLKCEDTYPPTPFPGGFMLKLALSHCIGGAQPERFARLAFRSLD